MRAIAIPSLSTDIDIENIQYINSKIQSKKQIFIQYQNAPLTLQTPWFYSPDGIQPFTSENTVPKFGVRCILADDTSPFSSFVHQLDAKIVKNAEKWYPRNKCVSSANESVTFVPTIRHLRFKVRIPYADDHWKCDAYDLDQQRMEGDLSEIVPGKCNMRFILTCRHIWFYGNTFGVAWYVSQLQYAKRPESSTPPPQQNGYAFR
jgi:hypothetical protein